MSSTQVSYVQPKVYNSKYKADRSFADSTRVDFRNPEAFHHDVNSVAGLLKQFFRELPDPLMTSELYMEFIVAAKIEDLVVRRDSIHAVINSLPDPNYATLRVLILVGLFIPLGQLRS